MARNVTVIPTDRLSNLIYFLRRERVMLDDDLAVLYGVEARALNQAVKRNRERFPLDFMFQLSEEEMNLVLQSRAASALSPNSSQIVMSYRKHRGRAYRHYAFTEQGVAMLSSVLRSPRAIRVNIEIMRAFVHLRRLLESNADLARRLAELETKYDAQFKAVFEAIRQLMNAREGDPPQESREIGFHTLRDSKETDRSPRKQRRARVRYGIKSA